MAKRTKAQAESSGTRSKRVRAQQSRVQAGATAPAPSYWEKIVAIGQTIPDTELEKLPRDLSKRLDHYLYGSWLKRE